MISDIARRVASISFDDLSAAAKERLLLCLLGNISVGVAGANYALVPEPAAPGGTYRLLSGRKAADRRAAAFWNGAVMHARTQDDFHPVGNLHIGTVVTPALYAVADEKVLSGKEFLTALTAGYMVATGLSQSFSPTTTPRGLRSTCLYSPFGATAAVARATAAPVEKIADALALTTAFAFGTTQTWVDGTDEWQVHTGLGAETGLRANELAAAGVRGGEHALDGPAGFYRALIGRNVTFKEIESDFDASAAIEANCIKRYPVSGICQSVVLAAERIAVKLTPGAEMARMRIEMNGFEINYPGNLNRGPFHSFSDRLMSAAFCAGSVIVNGKFAFSEFHTALSPRCAALIAATEVVEDPKLPLLSSRITIWTADGARVEQQVINSRDEVAIDWTSVDPWAAALWQDAGKTRQDYEKCRDLVRDLPTSPRAILPI